jgi:hypothetical protein
MMSPIAAIASGMSPPAPRPWTARPAISISIDVATPLRIEPAEKSAIANRKSGRRP